MLGEVSRWELGVWAALFEVNPWGEQRADKRAAIGHALLANINRGKGSRAYKVRDFMPYVRLTEAERQGELTEEIVSAFSSLAKAAKADERKAWKSRRKEVGKK